MEVPFLFVYVVCVCVQGFICVHEGGGQGDNSCVPQLLAMLIFERQLLSEPRAH